MSYFEKQLNAELKKPIKSYRRAVIDIGSNSVRLVIYEGPARVPLPICNEKALCGLGRGMSKNAQLNERAVKDALETLTRFRHIIEAYGTPPTKVIATAAVREASDGHDFVKAVEKLGFEVQILTGEQEAMMAGLGVLSFKPEADGLVGDMGGGSLELTQVKNGKIGKTSSLPIGPFHLMEASKGNFKKVGPIIDEALDGVKWLDPQNFQKLYAVGGAWRAIIGTHMNLKKYPLRVLHHYCLDGGEAMELCSLIKRQSRTSLEEFPGIQRRRIDTLPYAALVMEKVLARLKMQEVIVSAGGVREGVLFEGLSDAEKQRDPLWAYARHMAEKFSPVPDFGREIITLTDQLFQNEREERKRLRCMISQMIDVGAYFHADYRGIQSFNMMLYAPIVGLRHEERILSALTLYHRYNGRRAKNPDEGAIALLDWEDQQYAIRLGLALRFAADFSPKVGGPLNGCTLSTSKSKLTLTMPKNRKPLMTYLPMKRFQSLAQVMELTADIVYND